MSKTQDVFGISSKSVLNKPFMHVQYKTSSAEGQAIALADDDTFVDCILNTVAINEIAGASLATNEVTLPAGEYFIEAKVPLRSSDTAYLQIVPEVQSAAGETLLAGRMLGHRANATNNNANVEGGPQGRVTLASPTAIKLSVWVNTNSDLSLGNSVTAYPGDKVYQEMFIWKLDSDIETPVIADPSMTLVRPLLHIREVQPNDTAPPACTANAWAQRNVNTVVTNDIAGASLGSNVFTLPAGTYECDISALMSDGGRTHRIRLVDTSDSSAILVGLNAAMNGGTSSATDAKITGRFTLVTATTMRIEHFVNNLNGKFGIASMDTDYDEYFLDARFWRLDALVQHPVAPLPNNFSAPNMIINGSCAIWQRGDTGTGIGYVSIDRFYAAANVKITKYEQLTDSRQFGMELTAAAAGVDTLRVLHGIELEGSQIAAGKAYTFSADFYTDVEADITFRAKYRDQVGVITNEVDVLPTTVIQAGLPVGIWKRCTYTFYIGVLPNSGNETLELWIGGTLPAGQWTQNTDHLYVRNLKLEEGDKATPFAPRPYAEELALCQRYYWRGRAENEESWKYSSAGSSRSGPSQSFPVTMRTIPSVSLGGSPLYNNCTSGTIYASADGFEHTVTVQNTGQYYAKNALYSADAEL